MVQLSWTFPPPSVRQFPLDGGFGLNHTPYWYLELFMLDEEAGFACGEGEKIGFMHFVHQLTPHPTVPAPL